jgi:hypothetical protein
MWEGLEKQLHSRVYDLKDAEVKVQRTLTEVGIIYIADRYSCRAESQSGQQVLYDFETQGQP